MNTVIVCAFTVTLFAGKITLILKSQKCQNNFSLVFKILFQLSRSLFWYIKYYTGCSTAPRWVTWHVKWTNFFKIAVQVYLDESCSFRNQREMYLRSWILHHPSLTITDVTEAPPNTGKCNVLTQNSIVRIYCPNKKFDRTITWKVESSSASSKSGSIEIFVGTKNTLN